MFKRPYYIALGIVVLVTLVVLKLPARTTSQLKLAISGLFLPFFGLATSTQKLAEKAGDSIAPRSSLLAQIEQLQTDNQELKLRLAQYETAVQENSRFRQYYGWEKQLSYKPKLARVIGRDPANWWRTLRIDKGLRDGVTTNCAVLTHEGLVGRVSEAGFAQAQVVLLGDPNCRVAVLVEESRDHGIIAPASSSPLDPALVDLSYLPRQSQLRAGQRIVTSGEGGVFPPGILVGYLVDFRSIGYGLYQEARVKLAVRMNALEEVFVKVQ
ncbi:MAG TPA: rod shape-determining protein MreC [Verrucomicrobiae bacterium]|nr:rod shape-determining protein MreC [Verrucomicrobiae bacterium]